MKWIKQTDPEALPGWQCSNCGSLFVTIFTDACPPGVCMACGDMREGSCPGCGAGGVE